MDFSEVVSRVRQWISANPRGVEVAEVRESERRVDLTCPAGSFYITVPQNHQEEWVWLYSL